jgi:acylphosphatase
MSAEAFHAIVHGLVQGVFFRASTEEKARSLGIAGWVRNCSDGTVEIYAEGPREQLDQLFEWCHEGPPRAEVQKVDVEWISPQGATGFTVR